MGIVSVINDIGKHIDEGAAPMAQGLVEDITSRLEGAGKRCGVRVTLAVGVQLEIPELPDPEVNARVAVRGAWEGDRVRVQVLERKVGGRLIPEGKV